MTKEQISNLIEETLGFTNGWKISDEDYKMHCNDIAEQLVKNLHIANVSNQRELLIAYELSQKIDGASPTQAMAEEMADKFLSNL